VEIIQRRPLASDSAQGETVAIKSGTAFVVDRGEEMTVTLVQSGVRVQIITNLGRSEAIAVAESLH
jgi:hypothetical protein